MASPEHIVDASIAGLATALSNGHMTSVDLVVKYLRRISAYDCRGLQLNSVPLINKHVFDEAVAADDRRANGKSLGPLDGIPFTVKDSYKVAGLTVASGSEAFENLIANEDAYTVKALREAGAVLLGKTNMCPMAYGGMQRGVYGRAESPYNLDYLPAAFGSGSSNGSGVSVGASFAAFGLGEETVSSGRSPASNNGLVAYTPSRGLISLRGNWPLYVTCDVICPHTRSVDDLLVLLDVLAKEDAITEGDFWRDQPFLTIPAPWKDPPKPFSSIKDTNFLKGKRIVASELFFENSKDGPFISSAVTSLWRQAQADLEAAGAAITIIPDLPVFQAYNKSLTKDATEISDSARLPTDWNSVERGVLIANGWEDFLQANEDTNIPSLVGVDYMKLFPQFPQDNPQVKFTEPANAVQWSKLASYVESRPPPSHIGKSSIYDVPHLQEAAAALEQLRIKYFEKWMDENNFDFVAFPAAGDVGRADADVDDDSAKHAWTDGVKYSHGNRPLRHLGIPSVTVPMGLLQDSKMPMGLTFLGRAYDDENLLKVGYAYEQKTQKRVVPPLTPPLQSDMISQHPKTPRPQNQPEMSISECQAVAEPSGKIKISLDGIFRVNSTESLTPQISVFIDGQPASVMISIPTDADDSQKNQVSFSCRCVTDSPPIADDRNKVVGKIARDSTMIIVLGRNGEDGRQTAYLKLIHCLDQ